MTLEERMEIIKNKAKNDAEIEKAKRKKMDEELGATYLSIEDLSGRITDIILLANECINNGIEFPSQTNKYGYGHGSINFFADGINHHVGFMDSKKGWYKKGDIPYRKIKFLGIEQGGACGKYDFYTNGVDTFSKHEDTGDHSEAKLEHMKWFLREFPVFESAFYKWIDSLAD